MTVSPSQVESHWGDVTAAFATAAQTDISNVWIHSIDPFLSDVYSTVVFYYYYVESINLVLAETEAFRSALDAELNAVFAA